MRITNLLATICISMICTLHTQCLAVEPDDKAVGFNNEGVKALNAKEWDKGERFFRQALAARPGYGIATDNMIVLHRQHGLELLKQSRPKEALRELHKVAYANCDRDGDLARAIQKCGKDPRKAADRILLGDDARRSGDIEGAVVEYKSACNLNKTPENQKKLTQAEFMMDVANGESGRKD